MALSIGNISLQSCYCKNFHFHKHFLLETQKFSPQMFCQIWYYTWLCTVILHHYSNKQDYMVPVKAAFSTSRRPQQLQVYHQTHQVAVVNWSLITVMMTLLTPTPPRPSYCCCYFCHGTLFKHYYTE